MSNLEQKLQKLEEATTASQTNLLEKESKLKSASEALVKIKSELRSLDPEKQQTMQVNDTELPELISAKMLAQEEYDEAKKRHETNQKYLLLFREKATK